MRKEATPPVARFGGLSPRLPRRSYSWAAHTLLGDSAALMEHLPRRFSEARVRNKEKHFRSGAQDVTRARRLQNLRKQTFRQRRVVSVGTTPFKTALPEVALRLPKGNLL